VKKVIPVVVALVLILIIGGVAVGMYLIDKYSYSKEAADLDEYFQVSGEQLAIIMQDEMLADKALSRNGTCYFELSTVHAYMNEVFYADKAEGILLYATDVDVIRTVFGESIASSAQGSEDLGYIPAFIENDTVYVAAEYVERFTNYSYTVYEKHVQVMTKWESNLMAAVLKKTAVRLRGGVKSPVIRNMEAGEQVEVLEMMESWSKIKTSDSYIGYVENKFLDSQTEVEDVPVTHYQEPEYTSILMEGKLCLGWHSIGGTAGNDTLDSVAAESKGMNVIAPTWFSLSDNEGNFRSFATADYVAKAHAYGLQVWGVLDDFNYNIENNAGIDVYEILTSTSKRQNLIEKIIEAAVSYGLEGINLDFEKVTSESGIHYVQFLREISAACRNAGLVLSVDNYVPLNFNEYYRLDIQGVLVDYVIIMGYDEHWGGSGNPGSVASINYVENGIKKTLESVPAQKVVNALPLYTRVWKIDGAVVTDDSLSVRNTADFLSRVNAEPEWDEETCQNYAEWTSGSATYKLWIEDEESIEVKLKVMSVQNIGGVAVWRLGGGTEIVWELIRAYVEQ